MKTSHVEIVVRLAERLGRADGIALPTYPLDEIEQLPALLRRIADELEQENWFVDEANPDYRTT